MHRHAHCEGIKQAPQPSEPRASTGHAPCTLHAAVLWEHPRVWVAGLVPFRQRQVLHRCKLVPPYIFIPLWYTTLSPCTRLTRERRALPPSQLTVPLLLPPRHLRHLSVCKELVNYEALQKQEEGRAHGV